MARIFRRKFDPSIDRSGVCVGGPMGGKLINVEYAEVYWVPIMDQLPSGGPLAIFPAPNLRKGKYEWDGVTRHWWWRGISA